MKQKPWIFSVCIGLGACTAPAPGDTGSLTETAIAADADAGPSESQTPELAQSGEAASGCDRYVYVGWTYSYSTVTGSANEGDCARKFGGSYRDYKASSVYKGRTSGGTKYWKTSCYRSRCQ